MTVETESENTFFFNSKATNFDTVIFDIRQYLIASGSQNIQMIEEYRSKYGLIEEEYVAEWLKALLPYFRTKKSTDALRLSTQNQIYLEEKADINGLTYLEESKENWTGEPRVLVAFLECLMSISDFECIKDHLNRLFPMICQVLDDYRANNKIKGIELVKEFLRIVPADVFAKFNLHLVLYESLRVNVAFDSDELMTESVCTWIKLIKKVEIFGGEEFLKRADELLLILCRDVGTTSKTDRKIILIRSIGSIVNDLMEYCAIRYLRKIVVTLCEAVKEDFTCDDIVIVGVDSMEKVIKNCWIRLNCPGLQEMILNTFKGVKRIEALLKLVNMQNDE